MVTVIELDVEVLEEVVADDTVDVDPEVLRIHRFVRKPSFESRTREFSTDAPTYGISSSMFGGVADESAGCTCLSVTATGSMQAGGSSGLMAPQSEAGDSATRDERDPVHVFESAVRSPLHLCPGLEMMIERGGAAFRAVVEGHPLRRVVERLKGRPYVREMS